MKRISYSTSHFLYMLFALSLLILCTGCGLSINHSISKAKASNGADATATSVSTAALTPVVPDFSPFVGTWGTHATALLFEADGHAQFFARTYQWCSANVHPPCDSMQGNTIVYGYREEMVFTRVASSTAYGTLISNTEGHVGNIVSVTLESNDVVVFDDKVRDPRILCGPDSPVGMCGA